MDIFNLYILRFLGEYLGVVVMSIAPLPFPKFPLFQYGLTKIFLYTIHAFFISLFFKGFQFIILSILYASYTEFIFYSLMKSKSLV